MNQPRNNDVSIGNYSLLILWSAFSMLIVACAHGDLWLDEIWSLGFAIDANSVADIFCRFKHDNNHVLNTLYLYFVRNTGDFLVFRTLSILAGIASLWLLARIADRNWGKAEAILVLILAGSSFPLLLYFSEARGYALAICMSLLAFISLHKYLEKPAKTTLVIFWLVSCAGILAHASFLMVCLALVLSSLIANNSADTKSRSLLHKLLPHLPVFAFFAGWYNYYLIDMEIGGGPIFSFSRTMGQTTAFLLGFPDSAAGHLISVTVFLGILVVGLLRLYQTSTRWLFFTGIFILAPLAMLIASRPTFLYFRYFILCFPFFYLSLAFILVDSWRKHPKYRYLQILLLAAMLTGHWQRNFTLVNDGRGNYSGAVTKMLDQSQAKKVFVASDHDFRNQLLLNYYALRNKNKKQLIYVQSKDWLKIKPEWFIGHSPAPVTKAHGNREINGVGEFRLVDIWPSAEVSGFCWYLYRRKE